LRGKCCITCKSTHYY